MRAAWGLLGLAVLTPLTFVYMMLRWRNGMPDNFSPGEDFLVWVMTKLQFPIGWLAFLWWACT